MRATVTFTRCVQDSQEYGSDNEHMVSRVFFDLDVDGRPSAGLWVDLKQVVGSDFETGPIEVGKPHGYCGPFNYLAFRDAAERYYRSLVGSTGSGIHLQGGAKVRMQNNVFVMGMVVTFEVDPASTGGW